MHFDPDGKTMQPLKAEPELVGPDAKYSLPVFEEVTARLVRPRQPALQAALTAGSPLAEAFRMLRVKVKTIGEQRSFRCIGVVSVTSGEGKTTTALGLAAAMINQSDSRVLLIEADLRRPSIERSLDLGQAAGLAEYLEGAPTVCVRRLGPQGFFLLSAGRSSLGHPELLASARMRRLIEVARSTFDVVLVDCPPLLPVADSIVLQDALDGFLLVVQARRVPREVLLRALGHLEPEKVQGVVYRTARAILRRDDRYGYRAKYLTETLPSAVPSVAGAGDMAALAPPSGDPRPHRTAKKAAVAMVVLTGIAALYVGGRHLAHRSAPPPSTSNAEAVAAMQRVSELEEKLAAIEADKAPAEAKAAEDAEKEIAGQAAARGQKLHPLAVEKAKEAARREAPAEYERNSQEEKRLEDEQRGAEAGLAELRRRADEKATTTLAAAAPLRAPLPPPPTVTAAAASPPTGPAVKPGTLVSLSDPGVLPPVVQGAPQIQYPPIAARTRAEGTVELSILVDEEGSVVDANIVTAAGGRAGLNEAALDNVKRRRYHPATKDGVPVKVWYPVSVRFVLAKR